MVIREPRYGLGEDRDRTTGSKWTTGCCQLRMSIRRSYALVGKAQGDEQTIRLVSEGDAEKLGQSRGQAPA
jgi:hypothetical protein